MARKPLVATASDLNRIVRIEQRSGSSDGMGGLSNPTWTTVPGCAHIPAAIKPLSGYEQFTAQQLYPGVNYRIFIRYRRTQNINASMRVVYGNRIFEIRSVLSVSEANTTLELKCEELQAIGGNHR